MVLGALILAIIAAVLFLLAIHPHPAFRGWVRMELGLACLTVAWIVQLTWQTHYVIAHH